MMIIISLSAMRMGSLDTMDMLEMSQRTWRGLDWPNLVAGLACYSTESGARYLC